MKWEMAVSSFLRKNFLRVKREVADMQGLGTEQGGQAPLLGFINRIPTTPEGGYQGLGLW